jgi:hypothetical protein
MPIVTDLFNTLTLNTLVLRWRRLCATQHWIDVEES